MVGDVRGYCTLKSVETVIGYAGDPKELLNELYLQIWDVAVDNSGFLVYAPHGGFAAMVDMKDVKAYFYCSLINDVVVPPGLSVMDSILSATARRCRKGGYDWITRNMVILNSLRKGEFDDSFLFQEQ